MATGSALWAPRASNGLAAKPFLSAQVVSNGQSSGEDIPEFTGKRGNMTQAPTPAPNEGQAHALGVVPGRRVFVSVIK